MEPTTTAALSALSKAIFGGAVGPVKTFLNKKGLSKRVAKAAAEASQNHGIQISKKALRLWLEREDVKGQIAQGSTTEVESALNSLAFLVEGQPAENRLACARKVLHRILQEFQREAATKDAIVLGTEWASQATIQENRETRELIAAGTDRVLARFDVPEAFERSIAQLHPWRQETARRLVGIWPSLGEFVEALVHERDRGQVLIDWSTKPPKKFADAPAAAWCWFGSVAEDYKAKNAAIAFYKQGVIQGVTDSRYWNARAALLIDVALPQGVCKLREFVDRSDAPHTMATAYLAIAEKRSSDAETILSIWEPTDNADKALKTKLHVACLAEREDVNATISVLENAFEKDPNAGGIALAASRSLIWRGQQGRGDDNIADLIRASDLAVAARNARRTWGGDSVEATLEAVKASVLSNDLDRAWRLTQCAPAGEASFRESQDKRLCVEAAFIAASKRDYALAKNLISEIDEPFVTTYINGWIEFGQDNRADAAAIWRKAWDEATNDFDRLRSANALAPLGAGMPEMDELSTLYPDAVREIRDIHRVMSTSGDKIALLRARVGESEFFAALLAEQLAGLGKDEESAQVLETAANRWSSSRLMCMAASSYLRAGEYELAETTAGEAVNMAVRGSTGEANALMLRFEALEALERNEDSLRVARRMVSNDPQNENTRWVLVHSLARDGFYEGAWDVLNYKGNPIDPRSHHDARLWILLSSKHDTRPSFVSRSLRLMQEHNDDAELVGIFLASTLLAAGNAPETDIKILQGTMQTYVAENPESTTFRAMKSESPQDFLEEMREHFRRRQPTPEFAAIEKSICEGKTPLGFITLMFGKSYAEAAILRAARRIFSHDPARSVEASDTIQAALGKHVALDTTAAVTLALLEPDVQDQLIGSFSVLKTTTPTYKDALRGQHSCRMRSTMTIGWSTENQDLVGHTITEEEADRIAKHSDMTVAILERAHHKSWQKLRHLKDYGDDTAWLTSIDYALTNQIAFWCDDLGLRSVAHNEGQASFGTVDLIRALTQAGKISELQCEVAEATLISNYHVDLDSVPKIWHLAAQFDGWKAEGAASILTRPSSWGDTDAALGLLAEGIQKNAEGSPETVEVWVNYAAHGVMAIAGENIEENSHNLRLLLSYCFVHTGNLPDLFSFVLRGIRQAIPPNSGISDPLEDVLKRFHALVHEEFGPAIAKIRLLEAVRHLDETDKHLASGIILTYPPERR